MEIKRIGSQPSSKGPADYFTGTVRIDSPFQGGDPARVGGACVTFEPGARTVRKERKMKYTAMLLSFSLLVAAGAFAGQALADEANKKSQTISRAGSQPSAKGSSEYFTGNVRIDPLFPANDSAHFSGAYVTFEPGARSAWHIHPTGQYLLVTAGVGRTQEWGGPVEEIKPGDVIWCPPGVKHWHGASPTTAMTHIALTGTINGKNVEWMEKVTDEQYNGK